MNVDDYAAWAARIARAQADSPPDRERLSYLGLGLASEAGEVIDHIKKLLRDGDSAWRPDKVAEELGDLAYYWAALCVATGRNPSEILAASQAKIEERVRFAQSPYPSA